MSPILTPRAYQTEAVEALFSGWQTEQRLAEELATGLGKTVIMAHTVARFVPAHNRRVAIFVHRDELVNQTVEKIHSVAPDLTIGVVKAGRNEINCDVVIVSIQTIARANRLNAIPSDHFGLIIVDECHHAAAASYTNAIRYFGGYDEYVICTSCNGSSFQLIGHGDFRDCPVCLGGGRFDGTRVAGFTATLSRQDKLGLGDVFQRVAYKKDIMWGIRHGYLVDVRGKRIELPKLDLDGVKRSGGDYSDGALGDAMTEADAPAVFAHAYKEHASDRQGIVFCPTVATAIDMAEELNRNGIPSVVITGATPVEERALMFKRMRAGELQCLVNCMVLTEGFDMPQVSCIGVARPTSHAGLYSQMVGRGLRTFHTPQPESQYPWMRNPKTDCLILDLVGASEKNTLASIADLSETKIVPLPDETLTEAIDRVSRETPDGKGTTDLARVKITDVDLFKKSSSAWLQTNRGYWFIPTPEWLVTVVPRTTAPDTTFTVYQVWCGKTVKQPSKMIVTDVTLEYGQVWAESVADELDPVGTVSSRQASWKKSKKTPATEAQLRYARQLQSQVKRTPMAFDIPEGISKVELSDLISRVVSSRILDRYVPRKES